MASVLHDYFKQQGHDAELKHIQRKVYDGLNVLEAMGIITRHDNFVKISEAYRSHCQSSVEGTEQSQFVTLVSTDTSRAHARSQNFDQIIKVSD